MLGRVLDGFSSLLLRGYITVCACHHTLFSYRSSPSLQDHLYNIRNATLSTHSHSRTAHHMLNLFTQPPPPLTHQLRILPPLTRPHLDSRGIETLLGRVQAYNAPGL